MKKTSLFLQVFLFIGILFSSCQKKEKEKIKQSVRLNLTGEPQSLDPRYARDLNSINLMKMLFEGLMRICPTGKAELALAENVIIAEDGKTYTFFLRKSVWSNGQEVSAHDFVYAWKSSLSPTSVSPLASQLFDIKNAKKIKQGILSEEELGVFARSFNILEIQLEKPVPYFLDLLALPIFFPINKDIDRQKEKWAENEDFYVSNGPFQLKKWKHQDSLELKKNQKYWDQKVVQLEKLFFIMLPTETEMHMFEMKELDWVGSPFSCLPIDVVQNRKKEIEIVPYFGTSFFRINLAPKDKKKKITLSMRKALFATVNRESIAESVLMGGEKAAYTLVPKKKEKTQKEEKICLVEKEKKQVLTVTYMKTETNYIVMQALQRQWEKYLPIKIQLEVVEGKVFYQRLQQGEYQLALGSWIADIQDPINFLEIFQYRKNLNNNTSWENEKYIEFLHQASICMEKEKRQMLLKQAESILLEKLPIIPLFHLTIKYIKNEKIKDVYLSALGHIDFKWAYINEK